MNYGLLLGLSTKQLSHKVVVSSLCSAIDGGEASDSWKGNTYEQDKGALQKK